MAHHWQGQESRWGERVKVNIPVQLSADTLTGAEGFMRNLSLSGALVKADVELGLHSLIKVSIKMPPQSQRAEAVPAYVSRRLEEGVGIEWCEFAPTVVKDLLRSPLIPVPS
jgi:PilZ domain